MNETRLGILIPEGNWGILEWAKKLAIDLFPKG